jgi:hypothetical protein
LGLSDYAQVFADELFTTIEQLALLKREDFKDLKIPLGAALLIMAACEDFQGS